jgi:hypothetical protein
MLTIRLRPVVLLLLVGLLAIFLYAFLHESGHALAALLSGATLTAFVLSPFDGGPHVNYFGALTPAQTLLNNLAGMALPLLVWLGFVLAVPRRANIVLETFKLLGTLICLNTLLAWILLPFLSLAGRAPNDDVVNFLNNSGAPPLLVSAAALLLYVAGWALFLSKLEPLPLLLARLRSPEAYHLTPASRRTGLALGGLFVLAAVGALALNRLAVSTPDPFVPPAPYQPVAELDVAARPYESEALYAFHLDSARPAGLYLLVSRMAADYFDVTLVGPRDERRVLLHGEGYTPERDSARFEETLSPGDYQVLLTVRASRGTLTLYVKDLTTE